MSSVLVAVGFVGLLVAFLGLLGFIVTKMKGGRLAKTPFVKTGELASKGDAVCGDKNAISTEGTFIKPAEMLTSPVDGKECLMYSLTVTAKWKSGDNDVTVKMMEEKKSVKFQIDDGSGPITIDPGTSGDFEPCHKFNQTKGKGLKAAFTGGGIKFGATEFEVHPGGRYKGKLVPDNAKIQVEEKALEPQAMFYANGKWEDGVLQKHSWASLILSNKGRDETLAATLKTQRNATFALIGGGIIGPICLGIGMAIAPSPSTDGGSEKAKTEQTDNTTPAAKPADTKKSSPKKSGSTSKKSAPAANEAAAPKSGGRGSKSGGGRKGGKGKGKRR